MAKLTNFVLDGSGRPFPITVEVIDLDTSEVLSHYVFHAPGDTGPVKVDYPGHARLGVRETDAAGIVQEWEPGTFDDD